VLDTWIAIARGPVFRAALAFAIVGLARHAVITVWEMRRMARRAGDKRIPYRQVLAVTAKWLVPVGRLRQRPFLSFTSLTFHIAILIVPLFLAGHIALVKSGTGFSWWAINQDLADVLTIIAVSTAVLLVLQRAGAGDTRALSRFQDYVLPVLIAIPFASGFLVVHPSWNPFAYPLTMLVHVLSADLLLVLIPMTKLSHMVLLPTTQMVSELAWHFPPDAGQLVGAALGREEQPI
jgi:nitrate reductase gamma subunit